MKMVMIIYNEAIEAEVMDMLESCGLKNYTKVKDVYGRGGSSGIHLGNEIWPEKNDILFVACQEPEAKKLSSCVKDLRKRFIKEGIKVFVLPLEEMT